MTSFLQAFTQEEVAEEAFEEPVYTKIVNPKKKNLTKRVGRKYVKNITIGKQKQVSHKVFNTGVGADTHKTNAEVKNRNESVDKDTESPVDKENEIVKTRKKKTQEWKKSVRKPSESEKRKILVRLWR